MSGTLDTAKLKAMAISLWKRGGMDTLIKVAPRGMTPNPAYTAGYCTTFKYVAGRTPAEIEEIVGLAKNGEEVRMCLLWTHCHSPHSSSYAGILNAQPVSQPTHQGTSLIRATRLGLVPRSGSFWATHRPV